MVVELFGLPGSGKTTLAKHLAESLGKPVRVESRIGLVGYSLLFLLRYPARTWTTLRQIWLESPSRQLAELKLNNTFLHHNARYLVARRRGFGVIDQGHFQNLLSVFERPLSALELKSYLRWLPRPDLLLVLELDGATRQARLAERGYAAREQFGTEYVQRWQSAVEANFRLFRSLLPQLDIPYELVPADGSPEEVAARAREAIRRHRPPLAYVTNVRLPTEKAHGLQIVKSCEAFAASGVDVTLAVPRRRPQTHVDVLRHYDVETRYSLVRLPCLDVIPLIRRRGRWAQLLFNVQAWSFAAAAVAWAVRLRHRRPDTTFYSRDFPTLATLASVGIRPVAEIHDYRAPGPRRLVRFALSRARLIVTNSEGTAAALRAHYPRLHAPTQSVPNGVDISYFELPQTAAEARRHLGLEEDAALVCYLGSLEAVGHDKGVANLIRAMAELRLEAKRCIAYVIGGPEAAVERARQLAESVGVSSRVRFTGPVPHAEVPMYLRAMDAVAIPYPRTGYAATTSSPIKLFEFLAAGKAIVAADVASLRAYLSERTAEFFEPENPTDLARALAEVLGNADRRRELESAARAEAERYTWAERAGQILQALAGVYRV